jgi:hypothetical protein
VTIGSRGERWGGVRRGEQSRAEERIEEGRRSGGPHVYWDGQ